VVGAAAEGREGYLVTKVRTSGNMRVVLNTKLWPDMICEKANDKNIRISALDDGEVCGTGGTSIMRPALLYIITGQPFSAVPSLQVKIFLIACSMKEAEKLFNALEHRWLPQHHQHQ
jgi:hypothetical protein